MPERPSPRLAKLLQAPEAERVLGAFHLVKPLGKGGFAPVWVAKEVYGDTELRTVAIKLFAVDDLATALPGASGSNASTGARLKRDRIVQEARALCRVEHPNVVRFFALAADPTTTVLGLVMEYLHGRSLDRLLGERGELSVEETLAVGVAVASALVAVHQVGLIHRDIKPANVVEAMGVYKLIDFGIAAPDAPAPAPALTSAAEKKPRTVVLDDLPIEMDATRGTALTQPAPEGGGGSSGFTSGTIGYIDPGSFGARASPASDLYSLGALLFECLSGMLPAAAATHVEGGTGLKGEVLDGRSRTPPLRQIRPNVPEALGRLVDALLDPEPAKRPRSAESVALELERIRLGIAGRARPLPPEEVGPFRGLGRFEEKDRDVYFGRSVEIAASLEILRSRGLLALVGPSGSGKSSLARAGILPAIAEGRLGGWPKQWDTVVTVIGKDPRASIGASLAAMIPDAATRSPEALMAALAEHALATGRGVLLLIDQLEELVAVATGEGQAYAVDLLVQLGAQATPGVRAITAVRRDLLDPIFALGGLAHALTRGMLLVAPMSDATWGEVLDQALGAYGYRLEDDALRAELLHQLEGTVDAMPLVQFALTELWSRRDVERKIVRRAAMQAIGGIAGALEAHAEKTYRGLVARDADAGHVTRDLLLALTTPQGTRRSAARAELLRAGTSEAPARAVLEGLEEARLVVGEAGGITLAHEALLTQWRRLRSWVAEAREDRLLGAELERDAGRWEDEVDETLLWKKRRLVAAEDLVRRGGANVGERARRFLDASRKGERRVRRMIAAGLGAAAIVSIVLGFAGGGAQERKNRIELAVAGARALEKDVNDATEKIASLEKRLEGAELDLDARRYPTELAAELPGYLVLFETRSLIGRQVGSLPANLLRSLLHYTQGVQALNKGILALRGTLAASREPFAAVWRGESEPRAGLSVIFRRHEKGGVLGLIAENKDPFEIAKEWPEASTVMVDGHFVKRPVIKWQGSASAKPYDLSEVAIPLDPAAFVSLDPSQQAAARLTSALKRLRDLAKDTGDLDEPGLIKEGILLAGDLHAVGEPR